MVPVELVIYAIRAGIRLGQAADDALIAHYRDRGLALPSLAEIPAEPMDVVLRVFGGDDFIRPHLRPFFSPQLVAELRPLWDGRGPNPEVPGATDRLCAAGLQAEARSREAAGVASKPVGGDTDAMLAAFEIQQWRKDSEKRPLKPAEQFAVAFVDIGLEFIAGNPGLLGIGGRGEKLVAGFAEELSRRIPDDPAKFGPRDGFAIRLGQIALRAGLTTLTQRSELLISKVQYRDLLKGVTDKLVAAIPDDIAVQSRWWEQAESLVPAIIDGSIRTVAARPGLFFGDGFEDNALFGALAKAVLSEAAEIGVTNQFTPDGLASLFRAALGVVAEHPELVAKLVPADAGGRIRVDEIAKIFIGNVAKVLRDARPPFNGALGLAVAKGLLDSATASLPLVFRPGNPWEQFASGLVRSVIEALSKDIGDKAAANLAALFSEQQLVEFAAIFLRQASRTPQMLTGELTELQGIVAAVAAAAADAFERKPAPVLTAEDWLRIAAVAVEEAAANPDRLFGLNKQEPRQAVAAQLIGAILGVAAKKLPEGARTRASVLVGATLREIVVVTLQGASGNLGALLADQNEPWQISERALTALRQMVEFVAGEIEKAPATIGAKEALRLYRQLLPGFLRSGTFDARGVDAEKLIGANA